MKKIGLVVLMAFLFSYIGSCSSEGTDDLDVLTPNDSIQTGSGALNSYKKSGI